MSKRAVLLIVAALILIAVPLVLLGLSGHSELRFDPQPKVIGASTPVKLIITNPHGVRHVRVYLDQNGSQTTVFETSARARRWSFWRRHETPVAFTFKASGKHDGKAQLIAEATSNDFRGSEDTLTAEVDVNTRPPSIVADGMQHYINQGGSEMVLFTPSGYWTDSGVRLGSYTFRSFPVPGSATERFALFAFPWNMPVDAKAVVYATNPAGAVATADFWQKVFPKEFRHRDFELSDAFIQKVDNELDPGGAGDPIERFVKINRDMRRENNKTLSDLRLKTEPRMLWSGPFLYNSKVESFYADVRTYLYKGKKVDQETHLGFDLAGTQHMPVLAANTGKVIWAAPLGIYGNCIVLDHGYGLQSIYGHLSHIEVHVGDMVKKGQEMGRSGSTGMAGGDHLHFSMQIDGVQVNPVEWWDEHWIHDHILARFPAH
jgi:murein DD-endopeptidase MepM/ murein hydrolase activator NlpD